MKPAICPKFVSLIISATCYFLMFFFHSMLYTTYEKLVVSTVFAGFFVLHAALTFSELMNYKPDKDLSAVWSLYGVAAYLCVGLVLLIAFHGRYSGPEIPGTVAGILAMVEACVLLIDFISIKTSSAA